MAVGRAKDSGPQSVPGSKQATGKRVASTLMRSTEIDHLTGKFVGPLVFIYSGIRAWRCEGETALVEINILIRHAMESRAPRVGHKKSRKG